MGNKAVIDLFGIGLEEPYRWKDSVTSNPEIRIWALDALANGMRAPVHQVFRHPLHDVRWLKTIEDIYVWSDKNQQYLTHQKYLARLSPSSSSPTNLLVHRRARSEDYALGWCQALIESRIPFEMVHDHLLDAEHLAPYKTLILPNIAALSNAQCEQIRAFVATGESIIATQGDQPLRRTRNPPKELRACRPLRSRLDRQIRRPDA